MKTPYCSNCGRKVVILPHPGRNRKSMKRHKGMADHDLCRQCFKSLMYKTREVA